MPRTHGDRRDRRDPGHGRRGPDLVQRRNGDQWQGRYPSRYEQGAVPRRRHDPLRDDAERKPRADAHGPQARQGSHGAGHFRQVGARFRDHRRSHRYAAHGARIRWRGRLRHSARPVGSRRARIRPALPVQGRLHCLGGHFADARASRHRRCGRRRDEAARLTQPVLAPLDRRAIRQPGRRGYAADRRRCRCRPRAWNEEGARDHHRLHAALCPCRSL